MLPQPDLCTGCGGCAAVCPHNAIAMVADPEGFRYPAVDNEKCVRCGLCRKVCPVLTAPSLSEGTHSLAAQNQDSRIREMSSSGGVFTALAEQALTAGGAVCAAAYDANHTVRHEITREKNDLSRFRGAKYAQSEADHCFGAIKDLLDNGTPVLFVGTPCQCAGLKQFLRKDYAHLLTVDMVCHGVPSPLVWQRYVQERSHKEGSGVSSINLRSKSSGWSNYNYSVEFRHENGTCRTTNQRDDVFLQGFVGNLYLRPSCGACSFKGIDRCSDLTLGDCWGIWELYPEFDDDQGTSLLMIHTRRGQRAWDAVQSRFRSLPLSNEDALGHNSSALVSSAPHPKRQVFFENLAGAASVSALIVQCLAPAPVPKVNLLKRIIRRVIRH